MTNFQGLWVRDRVLFGGRVFLFEFKVVEQAKGKSAMEQLLEKGYAAKYRGRGEEIWLVGVEFSSKTRNIKRFEVQEDKG